ncbi:(2Fe-2S)-binding protein [Streptomyces caniferus]|uniref:(2Fe-2S)-binding protein n=1 Tax=Streptomyces caniferus TaxID=285557 RepID=UPI002E2CDA06|nr:(2Fe-2S)-binding protein [Streptomyces caniferus]
MTDPTAAWREKVAALGPFAAFETHPADSELVLPWRALSEVTREGNGILRERITAVRGALAARGGRPAEAVEERVAASVAHLGLVARVLSPMLGLAALHALPARPPGLDELRWHSGLGGAFALSLPRETVAAVAMSGSGSGSGSVVNHGTDPDAEAGADARAGAAAMDAMLDGPIRELNDAVAAFSVSPRVLWGNVASAVNGAATGIAAAAPALARPARTAALLLLHRPRLRDTHTLGAPLDGPPDDSPAAPNARFRRRSCCLIYRAAPNAAGATCGDCVLVRP